MNEKDVVLLVSLALLGLGALQLFGILAFLPQCSVGFNFFVVSGCISPITFFGLNPNFVAGAFTTGLGFAALVVDARMGEPED